MALLPTLVIAFRSLIMAVGIPGNLLVIVVYAQKRRRTSTDVFILWLAIVDLFVCLIMPLKIYLYAVYQSYTNLGLCKLTHYCSVVGSFLTMFLTNCITINRYCAVCVPLKRLTSPGRALAAISLCFLLSALIAIIAVFSAGLKQSGHNSVCLINVSYPEITRAYSFIILGLYLISLFIMVVSYVEIYRTIRKQAHIFKTWSSNNSGPRKNLRRARCILGLEMTNVRSRNRGKTRRPKSHRRVMFGLPFKEHRRVAPLHSNRAWDVRAGGSKACNVNAETECFELHGRKGRSNNIADADSGRSPMPAGPSQVGSPARYLNTERRVDRQKPSSTSSMSTNRQSIQNKVPVIATISRPLPSAANGPGFGYDDPDTIHRRAGPTDKYQERMKANNKTSKMLFLVTIIYFVTWIPLLVFQCIPPTIIVSFRVSSPIGFTLAFLLVISVNVNHALNPIVYSFVNVRFREKCRATLRRIKQFWRS